MEKVLISPSSFGQCGIEPINILKDAGFEVIINPFGRKLTETEVIDLGKDVVGIIAGVESLSCDVLNKLTKLKVISRVGVGVDSIDLECAKQKNIIVRNTPDGPTLAVAELTIALTLALLRKVCVSDKRIRQGIWKKEIGNLIFGKTVGIIGLGRIGKKTAELFSRLGCKIIAFDIYPDEKWAADNKVIIKSFDKVLAESDIISLHLPKTKTYLLGADEFKKMKNTALLINVSRGGVVDENALYQALLEKQIGAAALDVFENEPYNGKLKELDNVILTPHLGSYAAEAKLKMEIDAVNNFLEVIKIKE